MKPTFAKLGLKVNNSVKVITIGDQEIEVKQYLPINEKLDLISNVFNASADENNFANPVKIEVFTKLEILFKYTNLSFTEKQKEDLVKLYDLLESNGIFTEVINAMPENEYNDILKSTKECIIEIYAYYNSIMGLMEKLNFEYKSTDFNIETLKEKLDSLGDVSLLQDVVTKLG